MSEMVHAVSEVPHGGGSAVSLAISMSHTTTRGFRFGCYWERTRCWCPASLSRLHSLLASLLQRGPSAQIAPCHSAAALVLLLQHQVVTSLLLPCLGCAGRIVTSPMQPCPCLCRSDRDRLWNFCCHQLLARRPDEEPAQAPRLCTAGRAEAQVPHFKARALRMWCACLQRPALWLLKLMVAAWAQAGTNMHAAEGAPWWLPSGLFWGRGRRAADGHTSWAGAGSHGGKCCLGTSRLWLLGILRRCLRTSRPWLLGILRRRGI